jgi:hypothetical protein
MSKRMLADVLWNAANTRLWDGNGNAGEDLKEHSCLAVMYETPANAWVRVEDWLHSLGAPAHGKATLDCQHGRTRQGARYLFLLLAMHVAEDEGLTV